MSPQPDEKLTICMPFATKVWLANYARERRMTMSAVVHTLIDGLRATQEVPPEPPPEYSGQPQQAPGDQ